MLIGKSLNVVGWFIIYVGEQIWEIVQARHRLLAETLRRKMCQG